MTKRRSLRRHKPPPAPRFDRERWLEAALEVLAREGRAKLKIVYLAAQLGVTKGSFYHHFANREDFIQGLTDYWSEAFTEEVKSEVASSDLDASGKLLLLMKLIERDGLDRYDVAFRSWAAQDPALAANVRKVDASRRDFVQSLFADMGFEGVELEERSCAWLVHYTGHRNAFGPISSQDDPGRIERLHALFTRPLRTQ
jgi:AcrR family transcriptional regulator